MQKRVYEDPDQLCEGPYKRAKYEVDTIIEEKDEEIWTEAFGLQNITLNDKIKEEETLSTDKHLFNLV